MNNLYEIVQSYEKAIIMVDEDGVITDEGLVLLDEAELDIQQKTLNISKVLTTFDDNVAVIENEIKRLKRLKTTNTNNKTRLKDYLKGGLQTAGIEKMDLGIFKVSFRKSEIVSIDEGIILPEEYQKIKIEPDKVLLKKALKEGKEIEGVSLLEIQNLQIK